MAIGSASPAKVAAAQYVRMSTERQDFSVEFQMLANSTFALEHGFEIVRTYTDAGISGLSLEKRDALKALISDVVGGVAGFDAILVYDVSRWGRFQNPDEAAHYEFLCREGGVRVHYTAEPFSNDDSLTSVLVKQLKRAMAAEYSRELAARTSRAKRVAQRHGYWTGGPAPYGYRRAVVSRAGRFMGIREHGEWKGLSNGRTRLVLGPEEEAATVRRIFRLYVTHGYGCVRIAAKLRSEGIPGHLSRPWTRGMVRGVIRNPAYTGTLVYKQETRSLGGPSVFRQPEHWVTARGACRAIVTRRMFARAQRVRERRTVPVTAAALLEELRRLLKQEGRLTQALIYKKSRYHPKTYADHFGTLLQAYQLVGYEPSLRAQRAANVSGIRYGGRGRWRHLSDAEMISALRDLLAEKGYLSRSLINSTPGLPSSDVCRWRLGGMLRIYELLGFRPPDHHLVYLERTAGRRFGDIPPDGGDVASRALERPVR